MHRLSLAAVLLAFVAGCDQPLSYRQRVTGEWVGRAETSAERVLREWPGHMAPGKPEITADDPEVAQAIANTPPTDLEQAEPFELRMLLDPSGTAQLELVGQPTLNGRWTLTPTEGRRAALEISAAGEQDDAQPTSRKYTLEFFRQGDGFTLRETGSDRQYGRLIFTPSSKETQP